MHWSSAVVLGLAVLSTSNSLTNRWDDVETRHAWPKVPRGWTFHKPPSPDDILRLRLCLKQDRLDELTSSLNEISDPKHERYGAHLTKEQVDDLIAPHPVTLLLVEDWLKHHDIDISTAVTHSGGSSLLTIDVPVSKAERMLNTTYNVYYNPSEDIYVLRTISYALPCALRDHVNVVMPTTYFGGMRQRRATSFFQPNLNAAHNAVDEFDSNLDQNDKADCITRSTPRCFRALYKTSRYVPTMGDQNQLGVAEYFDMWPSDLDLQTFLEQFRKEAVGANITVKLINGGRYKPMFGSRIANLDIQYSVAMIYPNQVIYYSTAGDPPFKSSPFEPTNGNEPYFDFMDFVLSQPSIPQTITSSYADEEQTVPYEYAVTVCNQFMQFGVRGGSAIVESGFLGVGGGQCLTNDGSNIPQFQASFPAGCPYLTAVGSTFQINPEIAKSSSGGGFSKHFKRLSHQEDAVKSYLTSLGDQYKTMFNPSGRAIPDVSAQASNYEYISHGRVKFSGCGAILFATVITLLNDVRLSINKTSIGFANPLIYSLLLPGFTDITSGNNPGCGTQGFNATKGWDAITGVGTPNFEILKDIVEKLP